MRFACVYTAALLFIFIYFRSIHVLRTLEERSNRRELRDIYATGTVGAQFQTILFHHVTGERNDPANATHRLGHGVVPSAPVGSVTLGVQHNAPR